MSLNSNNLLTVVKKQYLYKLYGNLSFFPNIILSQIIGIFFSLRMNGVITASNEIITFKLLQNTATQVLIFTIICVIVISIYLNLKVYKNIDFTLVSNRFTSNLSSIALLITYDLFGAATFALSNTFFRLVKYLLIGSSNIIDRGFYISPLEFLCSFCTAFLYILLFSSGAYFFTALIEKSRAFIIVLFSLIVVLPRTAFFTEIINFYGSEHNFFVFVIKVLLSSITFFLASIFISNNMEVRR